MKKIFLIVLAAISVSASAQSGGEAQKREFEIAKGMEVMLSVYRDANLFYVDSISPSKLVGDAMRGMLTKLDPYSEYIPEEDLGDFELTTTGKYGGVGSLIRQRGEWVEISEPYKNTPSARIGLKAGDRLLKIDTTDLKGLGSAKVSDLLKGDPNTTFTLVYRPIADTTITKTVEITRERIKLPGVPYYGMAADSIGYIRYNSFMSGGANEVKAALKDLKSKSELKGLILDLRNNGGGIVGEAVDIINMFVPSGLEVLTMKGKVSEMNANYKTNKAPEDLDIPLTVLINSSSASASEIVAGALQDLDRAVIIGQRSFGKGLVQSTRDVPYKGILKMTTAKYYTPSGRCIQALDYAHRREDGSVGTIPDSLINEFQTAGGRKVYDGGGINPDVKLEDKYMSKFGALVYAYGYVDDFANEYCAHNTPARENYRIDDKTYADFVEFMKDKEFDYESLSAVKLKELRDAAEKEEFDDRIVAELDAIANKIKDDKSAELEKNRVEIGELLESAILTRLYYAEASIENSLRYDVGVKEAISILNNPAKYNEILTEIHINKN